MVESLHGDELLAFNVPQVDPLDVLVFASQRDQLFVILRTKGHRNELFLLVDFQTAYRFFLLQNFGVRLSRLPIVFLLDLDFVVGHDWRLFASFCHCELLFVCRQGHCSYAL